MQPNLRSLTHLFRDLARKALEGASATDDLVGQQLGRYLIKSTIAFGGMGVVYLGCDTKLQRDVAIKLFPADFADDERRFRLFEREARLLASLNHPNIATIHGLETFDDKTYLVLEHIDGATLTQLLEDSRIARRRAVDICLQISSALEAAHHAGVVHRDLKPGNVMVTRDGLVKVLDFGIAKRFEVPDDIEMADGDTDMSTSGLIMGTPSYMSPEQVRGEVVDQRTDIWAFGCLLYEVLTGKRAFEGRSVGETLSAILRDEPDLETLAATVPGPICSLVRRCLQKEAHDRLHSMADARIVISEVLANQVALNQSGGGSDVHRLDGQLRAIAKAVCLVGVGILIGVLVVRGVWMTNGTNVRVGGNEYRSVIQLPGTQSPNLGFGSSLAISRDGQNIAYIREIGTSSVLHVKGPRDANFRALTGTEGARSPFFSPHGDWIGFFDDDDNRLKRVLTNGGGRPVEITDAAGPWGADWGLDNRVYFSAATGGLASVSADGTDFKSLTEAEPDQHTWPTLVDGAGLLLFTMREVAGDYDSATIAIVNTDGGDPIEVLRSAYYPQFVAPGYLIYVQGGSVRAISFDPDSGTLGTPFDVTFEGGIWKSSWIGYAEFALSATGTLVHLIGGENPDRAIVVAVDGSGQPIHSIATERGPYRGPRLSPDGEQLALVMGAGDVDIWIYPDLTSENPSAFTQGPAWDGYPVWHPSAPLIAFSSWRDGPTAKIYVKDRQSHNVSLLLDSPHDSYPSSFSPAGDLLALWEDHPTQGENILIFSFETSTAESILHEVYNESRPIFSPDGTLLAYESNEQNEMAEVYVRPYPQLNPPLKVSVTGGFSPRWGPDSRELYYSLDGALWKAEIERSPELRVVQRSRLLVGPYGESFDVAPDGESFVMLLEGVPGDPPLGLSVHENWFVELERRSGGGQ